MGIYVNHYVEYRIEHPNGTHMLLISGKEADERLVSSKYYQDRKSTWFSEGTEFERGPMQDIDVELTDTEAADLKHSLTIFPPAEKHGWYEVNKISTTLMPV